MKRKFFLLPVASLLLGGCSQTEQPGSSGIIPPANQVDQIVEAIKNTTEYKTEFNITLSSDGVFPMAPSVIALQSRIIHGVARIKGLSSGVNGEDMSMKVKNEMALSEILEATHHTASELRAMLESNPGQYESYEIDEANDYFMILSDQSDATSKRHEWQYTVKDEGSSQFKIGEFYQNYLLRSEYLSIGEDAQNYYSSMIPIVEIIKQNEASVTYSENVYSVDLSADPVDIGYGQTVSKVHLKPSNNEYVIGYEGKIEEGPVQMDVQGEFRVYDINHSDLNVPEFNVYCPFDHSKTWQYVRYSETQHIKACAFCHKYIGQPVNHSMNEEHGICTVCDIYSGMPRDVSRFEEKLSNGIPYLGGYRRANGKYYDTNVSFQGAIYFEHVSLSGVTGDVAASFYAGEDNILALQFAVGSEIPLGSCIFAREENILVFKNVSLSFTPAQQAIIDNGNPNEVSQVYREVLDLDGSTVNEIKSRFAVTNEYQSYRIRDNHDEGEDHTFTPEGTCFEASYSICQREGCEQCIYAHGDHNHQYQVSVIDKPTWGNADQVYFTVGECSHCHDHNPFIGCIDKTKYHESGNAHITQYDSDGYEHGYTYAFLPHMDHNNDHLCDLCGCVRLSVTYNEKVYTMYYSADDMMSYHYWDDSDPVYPGDHYSVRAYRLLEDETIIATITIDAFDENSKIKYTMEIGESSYVSPVYDWTK